MSFLERDSPPAQDLADGSQQRPRGLNERHAFDFATSSGVSEVGVERRGRVRFDEHRRVRAPETREVADVRLTAEDVWGTGDEKRLVEQGGKTLDPSHTSVLPALTRNSRASL